MAVVVLAIVVMEWWRWLRFVRVSRLSKSRVLRTDPPEKTSMRYGCLEHRPRVSDYQRHDATLKEANCKFARDVHTEHVRLDGSSSPRSRLSIRGKGRVKSCHGT